MASTPGRIAHATTWGVAVVLAVAAGMTAVAGPGQDSAQERARVTRRLETYPVEGGSRSQWAAQMRGKGPRDPVTGRRYSGYAQWQVSWSWQTWPVGGGRCQLAYWDVAADITITLPAWTGRDKASAVLARHWDRFIGALVAHEDVHARHGEQAAAAVARMFAELPVDVACEGSRERVDRAARAIIDEYRRRDRRFDRETRHGILP